MSSEKEIEPEVFNPSYRKNPLIQIEEIKERIKKVWRKQPNTLVPKCPNCKGQVSYLDYINDLLVFSCRECKSEFKITSFGAIFRWKAGNALNQNWEFMGLVHG